MGKMRHHVHTHARTTTTTSTTKKSGVVNNMQINFKRQRGRVALKLSSWVGSSRVGTCCANDGGAGLVNPINRESNRANDWRNWFSSTSNDKAIMLRLGLALARKPAGSASMGGLYTCRTGRVTLTIPEKKERRQLAEENKNGWLDMTNTQHQYNWTDTQDNPQK
jgi:hypothetical protein